jgi:hypothetical protein
MSHLSLSKYIYLAYLSNPKSDRTLYRVLRRQPVRSMVEIGIGRGHRALNMIAVLQRFHPGCELKYTGIDLFEARPAINPGITLKLAHKRMKAVVDKVQLIPGDPYMGLARCANLLPNTDLIVISADQEATSLQRAWAYLPRMIHDGSLIFHEIASPENGRLSLVQLSRLDVERLAAQSEKSSRRVA